MGSFFKKKEYLHNAAHNIALLAELKSLLALFKAENISVILLKGAALLDNVYTDITNRPMADLDLLVKKESVSKLDALLKLHGYFALYGDYTPYLSETANPYLSSVVYQKSTLINPILHLHWHLVNTLLPVKMYYNLIDLEAIWQAAEPISVNGTEALVLAQHHFLIHLCEHALSHSYDKHGLLLDIHKLIGHYDNRLDWQKVIDETLRFGLSRPVYYSLYFTAKSFDDTQIPQSVLDRFKPKQMSRLERWYVPAILSGKTHVYFRFAVYLAMSKGLRSKLQFAWRCIFPAAVITNRIRVYSDNNSILGYYFKRLVRGIRSINGI